MPGFNITGYLIFAFVTSITPGPNNYLLFSYGKTYGFNDSSKLMSGIFMGFFVMLYASGYGIAEIITQNPTLGLILKIVSSIWLFYLAIVLSKLSADISENSNFKVGFYQAFLMQFVNPKAWIMAITGAGAFLPHYANIHLNVFVFAITFGLVGIPCMISWIKFGDLISGLIKSPNANKRLGIALFILMITSILMIWI
jgi:threonine/homoserine/homoserine lactone efflux protein